MKLLKYGRYYDTYLGAEQTNENVSYGGVEKLSPKQQKSVERMMETLSIKLSESEKERLLPLVEYLKTHDCITRQEAELVVGKSQTTVLRYLRRLEQLGVVEADKKSMPSIYWRK